MPELPEVETVAKSLIKMFSQKKILRVVCHRKNLRYPLDQEVLNQICCDQKIKNIERRGKYMVWSIKKNYILVHLGMSGRFCKVDLKTPLDKHDHVSFVLKNEEIRYRDPRRFGLILPLLGQKWQEHRLMSSLGVEPLQRNSARLLLKQAQRFSSSIKQCIMNQKVIVGVGNIYANEALFASGIHPNVSANSLTLQEWRVLLKHIRRILNEAIARGGTTLEDEGFSDVEGNYGEFALHLYVYGRKNKPCYFCGDSIQTITISGRSTFFCPSCQD